MGLICNFNLVIAQYQVKSSTFGNGGGILNSAGFQSSTTLGQTFIGSTGNASYNSFSGYWYSVNVFVGLVREDDQYPKRFELYQNYPNPFNPVTKIKYAVPKATHVRVEIYNVLGQRVRTLVNEEKQPGFYIVDFNASSLASGFYIYRLEASGFSSVKKMTVTK
jgi:hypothetical protein